MKILKHFTIAYRDDNNNSFEICEYAERSDEAIKNAVEDIPNLKNNHNYIFRCTNESDLDWLSSLGGGIAKQEWDMDSLSREGTSILKEIKEHFIHIFNWIKISLKRNV